MRRLALVGIALVAACSQSGAARQEQPPSLKALSVKQLIARIDRNVDLCIGHNVQSACHDSAPLHELWRRGYCSNDAQGSIGRCTREEIEDDMRFNEEMH
jgi:hypothetical protein